MKCIVCGEDAEYIAEGNSLCNKHFDWVVDGGIDSLSEFFKREAEEQYAKLQQKREEI